MQESGLVEIIPLLCILTTQGQYLAFSWSWTLRAHHQVAAVTDHLMEIRVCCWLKWQATFFFFCPQPPRIHPPHCWLSSPSNKPYLICYCCCLVAKLCPTLWSAARQAFLSFTISWSLFKLISAESVMLYNHLTLCCSLLLLPSIFPSIRVFSNESALRISWPKYWSFSFSNRPSNEYSGLISFRMDWFDLLAVQGTLKSLLQHQSSKASILWHSAFFIVQLSHPYMTIGKTIALTRQTFVSISH